MIKLTQKKDREKEREQRVQKLFAIILEKPGLTKRQIQRLASNKSKSDWMNPNTSGEYLDKLGKNGEVIVKKSSYGHRYYLPADYYTQESLNGIFQNEITVTKKNLEQSIKKLQNEWNKVNERGKTNILKHLEQMSQIISESVNFTPDEYVDLHTLFDDKEIIKFKKYCKSYPNKDSENILKDSEKIYTQFKTNSKKIENIKKKIQFEKDKEKKYDLVMEFLSKKGQESHMMRELQGLHGKMLDFPYDEN